MNDKCEAIYNLFNNYIDGTLNSDEKQVLQDHLKDCKVCMDEFGALENTVKSIKTLKSIQPPDPKDNFSQEIISKLDREQKKVKLYTFPSFRYIAAGLLVMGLVAFIIFNLHLPGANHSDNLIVDSYAADFNEFISNDLSIASDSGLPTDDYGLIMVNGND